MTAKRPGPGVAWDTKHRGREEGAGVCVGFLLVFWFLGFELRGSPKGFFRFLMLIGSFFGGVV